jgi:tetratricopeptide (TPR) repeat protein
VDQAIEPRNEEAYALYLRSAALPMEPAVNKQGLDMLERAVQLDPGYPPAWLALARRYYTEARYGNGGAAMMTRFEMATERALSLDPNYVAPAAALIVVRSERGDLIGAYQRATDLVLEHPDSLEAQFALSYVLRYAGVLDEAADRCERAMLLDRGMQTTSLRSCAKVFLLRADYPRTMTYLRLDQGADYAKALSIDMLVRQGKTQEALQVGSPNIPEWKSYDMLLACLAGKPSSEVAALAASVRVADDPELNYFAAAHLTYCNQTASALDLLGEAIKGNYCSYPAIESDPLLAPLRSKPEYVGLRDAALQCQQTFLAQR